jgi:hypothetical protein
MERAVLSHHSVLSTLETLLHGDFQDVIRTFSNRDLSAK